MAWAFSENTLRLQKKGYTTATVCQNLKDCWEAGIYTEVNWVIGVFHADGRHLPFAYAPPYERPLLPGKAGPSEQAAPKAGLLRWLPWPRGSGRGEGQ